jgi:ribosome-binding protein aMBF1 (putative translation factor)
MSFGNRLQEARKNKGLSQEDVAQFLKTKAPVIGRYERDEMKPSIEVASKLADLLEISLDYLVGKTDIQVDKNIFKRIVEISKFSKDEKNHIYAVLDAFIAKAKIQSLLQ